MAENCGRFKVVTLQYKLQPQIGRNFSAESNGCRLGVLSADLSPKFQPQIGCNLLQSLVNTSPVPHNKTYLIINNFRIGDVRCDCCNMYESTSVFNILVIIIVLLKGCLDGTNTLTATTATTGTASAVQEPGSRTGRPSRPTTSSAAGSTSSMAPASTPRTGTTSAWLSRISRPIYSQPWAFRCETQKMTAFHLLSSRPLAQIADSWRDRGRQLWTGALQVRHRGRDDGAPLQDRPPDRGLPHPRATRGLAVPPPPDGLQLPRPPRLQVCRASQSDQCGVCQFALAPVPPVVL